MKLKNTFDQQKLKQLEIQKRIVVDEKAEAEESDEESFDSADRRADKNSQLAKMDLLMPSNKNGKKVDETKTRLLRNDSSGGDINELPVTPRKYHKEGMKVKNKSPLKEIKNVSNIEKENLSEKPELKPSKTSLRQIEKSNPDLDRPATFKRMTTEEYDRKVLTIKELHIKDKFKFVTNPPPKGQIVQVSIFRDKTGLKNHFYPKYHVVFSVI